MSGEFSENEVNSDLVEDSVEKQGDEDLEIGKQVDEWFEKLDTDNDGCLEIKDIKPYVEEYLRKKFDIEASAMHIENTFEDISDNGRDVTKSDVFEQITQYAIAKKQTVREEQK